MPSSSRPEYAVRIEDGPGQITETGVGPSFRWTVLETTPVADAASGSVLEGAQVVLSRTTGDTPTRFQAWACALATLKGLMRLERSRH